MRVDSIIARTRLAMRGITTDEHPTKGVEPTNICELSSGWAAPAATVCARNVASSLTRSKSTLILTATASTVSCSAAAKGTCAPRIHAICGEQLSIWVETCAVQQCCQQLDCESAESAGQRDAGRTQPREDSGENLARKSREVRVQAFQSCCVGGSHVVLREAKVVRAVPDARLHSLRHGAVVKGPQEEMIALECHLPEGRDLRRAHPIDQPPRELGEKSIEVQLGYDRSDGNTVAEMVRRADGKEKVAVASHDG
eukprot:scaffold96075_cov63-Phaeocystis_antarctica.AAC.1